MATVRYTQAGSVVTLSAATFLILGDADPGTVSSWVVELRPAAATYSVTFKGRLKTSPSGTDPVTGDEPLAYTRLKSNTTTDGATAITGTIDSTIQVYRVTSDGCSVALDVGTLSAGSIAVIAFPVRG